MTFILDKVSIEQSYKDIYTYVNNNPYNSFIILTQSEEQSDYLGKKIKGKCKKIGEEYTDDGKINTYKISDNIKKETRVIISCFNYLPFLYKALRDITEDYYLIVVNATKPFSNCYDASKFETTRYNGIEYVKPNENDGFLRHTLWGTKSFIKEGNKVKTLNYPKVVLDSFLDVCIYTPDFNSDLKECFDRYCKDYKYVTWQEMERFKEDYKRNPELYDYQNNCL